MLDNRLGIRLILHLGQTVPVPPPRELLTSLLRAEIITDASGVDGFQLMFAVGAQGAPDPLAGGALDILARARIGVITGAIPEMLFDGVITHHAFSPGLGYGSDVLTVTGRDLSVFLDLEERNASYENQSDSVIVTQILGRYSQLGLIPRVENTSAPPSVVQRIPRQAETDLQFIKRLAQENGFVFYIEPETFGVSSAYFGPSGRGPQQAPLRWGRGPSDNLNSLRATADGLATIDVSAMYFDTASSDKALRTIPPDSPDNDQALARAALPARRRVIHRSAGPLTEGLVASTAAALIADAPDPVVLEGEVDILRYGQVLRPRSAVQLAGAGAAYDGSYRVRRVVHKLERGAYTQSFTLGREGTGATGSKGTSL